MLKADIKLPIYLPLITIIASLAISFFGLSPMAIIIYIGTLYILIYYSVGYIKRKDALIITEKAITVKTPFRLKEFEIAEFKEIFIAEGHTQIKGVQLVDEEEKTVTICGSIYTEKIETIYNIIISNRSNIDI